MLLETVIEKLGQDFFFLNFAYRRDYRAFIHLKFSKDHPIRLLLELMVTEYADRKEDTQAILKPMTMTLLMHTAREYSYHRNYISTLLHQETGQTFSEILLELRMERQFIFSKAQHCRSRKSPLCLGILTFQCCNISLCLQKFS